MHILVTEYKLFLVGTCCICSTSWSNESIDRWDNNEFFWNNFTCGSSWTNTL